MATWTTITDAALEPGKPIRSVDGLALRDNAIAITEGASGAPKIRAAAFQPPASGTDNIVMTVQDAEIETIIDTFTDAGLNNRADSGQHLGVVALVPGVITAYLEHRQVASRSVVRVLKNGSVVQSFNNDTTTFVAREIDVTVDVGDAVIFQHRCNSAGNAAAWRNLRIYSATPDMAVA